MTGMNLSCCLYLVHSLMLLVAQLGLVSTQNKKMMISYEHMAFFVSVSLEEQRPPHVTCCKAISKFVHCEAVMVQMCACRFCLLRKM